MVIQVLQGGAKLIRAWTICYSISFKPVVNHLVTSGDSPNCHIREFASAGWGSPLIVIVNHEPS